MHTRFPNTLWKPVAFMTQFLWSHVESLWTPADCGSPGFWIRGHHECCIWTRWLEEDGIPYTACIASTQCSHHCPKGLHLKHRLKDEVTENFKMVTAKHQSKGSLNAGSCLTGWACMLMQLGLPQGYLVSYTKTIPSLGVLVQGPRLILMDPPVPHRLVYFKLSGVIISELKC